MGYPEHIFVQPVVDEFVCLICKEVVEDPVRACNNDHIFCSQCIHSWATCRKRKCPTCRARLSLNEARLAQSLLNRHTVRCAHVCEWTGTLQQYRAHVNQCEHAPVACPFAEHGCTHTARQTEMDLHTVSCVYTPVVCQYCGAACAQHKLDSHQSDTCPKTLVTCANGCGAAIQRCTQADHDDICEVYVIPCPNAEHGCTAEAMRALMRDHVTQCSHTRVSCAKCKAHMSVWALETHSDVCTMERVVCPNHCTSVPHIVRRQMPTHLANECPKQIIDCKYKVYGCTHRDTRDTMKAHEADRSLHGYDMYLNYTLQSFPTTFTYVWQIEWPENFDRFIWKSPVFLLYGHPLRIKVRTCTFSEKCRDVCAGKHISVWVYYAKCRLRMPAPAHKWVSVCVKDFHISDQPYIDVDSVANFDTGHIHAGRYCGKLHYAKWSDLSGCDTCSMCVTGRPL